MPNYFICLSIALTVIFIIPKFICVELIALNKILLNEHNKYRKKHGVPNLQIDNELISAATKYAESLARNRDNNYLQPSGVYQGDEKLGENLFQCNNKACKMENYTQPLDIWYKEISQYNFDTNEGEKGTSNFTQMVWKSTKKMGCGVGQKTENSYKVVCYYLPRGNIPEKYKSNVLKPILTNEEKKILDPNGTLFNGTNDINETEEITYLNYEDFISKSSFNLNYCSIYLGLILLLLFA